MSFLVSIAVGPVQDFIAAARRSRDLWYGSYLLSEISKAAARSANQRNATLIFPYSENLQRDLQEGSDFTVVNKLLLLTDDPPEALCKAAKEAAQNQLKRARESGGQNAAKWLGALDGLIDRQLHSLIEFNAAWVSYDPAKHRDLRRRVEALMDARKAVRDFPPYHGETRPKSSLDGFRESVLVEGSRKQTLFESRLKGNEQLDAIGLIKRFADPFRGNPPSFDSTLDIAAVPYVNRIQDSAPYKEYTSLFDLPSYLYEHESRELFDFDEKDLTQKQRKLLSRLKAIRLALYRQFGAPKPPYYALLIGDGDSMGAAIGNLKNYAANQDLSQLLSRFASEASRLIKQAEGCPIYTGGDDVMALLPLHNLLDCSGQIRDAFAAALRDYGVTFSAGIVIAHALEPLSEVLRLAREAESRAKGVPDKNAVAFTVCPRSGANVEIRGKWDSLIPLLKEIADSYLKKTLSLSFAHELRELDRRTPQELDSIIGDLALSAAGKKEQGAHARSLVQVHVQNRAGLQDLYRAMLVARPIYRSSGEARPPEKAPEQP